MVHLRVQMLMNGDRIADLADYLKMTRQTLSTRLNGKTQFKPKEIMRIAERYSLDSDDIMKIFF